MPNRNPRMGHAVDQQSGPYYLSDGMPATWAGVDALRTLKRFGLFFQTPGTGWRSRNVCWPTLADAVEAGERMPAEWRCDHVYDFCKHEVAHVFEVTP